MNAGLLNEGSEIFLKFMKDGGPFMIIILGVFITGLLIAIEKSISLSLYSMRNKKFISSIEVGDKSINQSVAESRSPLAKIWLPIFGDSMTSVNSIAMSTKEARYVRFQHIVAKRSQLIALLANVATMLGLLGTIVGLISSFASIASVSAAEKSEVLGSSISMAMNTTVGGLIAAIPLLLLHYGVQSKIRLIDTQCESTNSMLNGKIKGGVNCQSATRYP